MSLDPRLASERRLRAAVESSPSGILMTDAEGRIVLVNREVERLFGYPREELLGKSVDVLVPSHAREPHAGLRRGFLADAKIRAMGHGRELYGLRKDGIEVPIEIGLTPVHTEEGMFVVSSIVDIGARKEAEAERRRLEDQLRQAQKLEAIGTLAGGIAHDFNNLLGAIVGYAELIGNVVKEEGRVHEDLRDLLKAADRGRRLVEHILTFSRRQEVARRPVALSGVVQEVAKLLRVTLPASIEIRLLVHPGVPQVLADTTSIHQVLMNLGTNAAHAMPTGGTLSILLEPFYVRDSMARSRTDLREGPYALMVVTDTGTGMDPETRSRVFEPFFTTRLPGTGTGLGLAMVHGLMRDHDGAVDLESELGRGTTVRCFFPGLTTEMEDVERPGAIAPRGNGMRILLVEDEPQLASIGARRLDLLGYRATPETSSVHALETLRANPERFDVVITDFSMPRMDGLALARKMSAIRPGLPIILVTGYAEGVTESEAAASGVRLVLRKPVTLDQLGEAVHHLVTERSQGTTSA